MKKGFTLVELLGVILILSVLLIIVFVTVSSVIDNGKNSIYQNQINSILSGAYDWSLKHPNGLPEKKGDTTYINLIQLVKENYVDELVNPKTGEYFPVDLVISIKYTGGNYKYDNKHSKLNGNYLFTVLINNKSKNLLIKPTITLKEDSLNTLSQDGNYTTKFEIGTEYKYYEPSATENDTDVTNITEIIFDKMYDEKHNQIYNITTNKLGLFYKYIVATDNSGNSNYIIQNIIIEDTTAPVLTIPENVEISRVETSFDIMEGVTCTDNSDKCNVTTSGDINFGVPGPYTITYTAKDPSGNTTSKTRTIRVSD